MAGTILVDKGFKKAIEGLRSMFQDVEVVVGIMGSDADQKVGDGLNMATLGAIHEYGAPSAGIPQRSFLAATMDEKQESLIKAVIKAADKLAQGKLKLENVHDQFGLLAQKWVVEKINSNIAPALKPATIKKKGSSQALVDTGRLRASIRYEVRDK
jgi:phage gpG-like protein